MEAFLAHSLQAWGSELVNIIPMCAYCGGKLVVKRLKDAKWEKHGRKPQEGRAELFCDKCFQRAKKSTLTPERMQMQASHFQVEEPT